LETYAESPPLPHRPYIHQAIPSPFSLHGACPTMSLIYIYPLTSSLLFSHSIIHIPTLLLFKHILFTYLSHFNFTYTYYNSKLFKKVSKGKNIKPKKPVYRVAVLKVLLKMKQNGLLMASERVLIIYK